MTITFPAGTSTKGTVRYRTPVEMEIFKDFATVPRRLQGLDMQVIYISPDGQLFNLHGKNKGRQGVMWNQQVQGDFHWPFELVTTKGAYIYGADIERVNVNERMISCGIIIGGDVPKKLTAYEYSMAEEHWWNGQDENRDGWLGIFTRFSGWRWIKVRPFKTIDTPQKRSPLANEQYFSAHDVNWIAAIPYYSKITLSEQWQAKVVDFAPNDGKDLAHTTDPRPYKHTLQLANRGDLPAPVKYVISSPGQAAVSDNGQARMVELPTTIASDGPYLCDTETGHRTLTAATERVDNFFYQQARASKILEFALHDLGSLGQPLGYGFNKRFMFTVPPKSIAHLDVEHSHVGAVITAYLPQRFKRSR